MELFFPQTFQVLLEWFPQVAFFDFQHGPNMHPNLQHFKLQIPIFDPNWKTPKFQFFEELQSHYSWRSYFSSFFEKRFREVLGKAILKASLRSDLRKSFEKHWESLWEEQFHSFSILDRTVPFLFHSFNSTASEGLPWRLLGPQNLAVLQVFQDLKIARNRIRSED